jgi:8-oxo-dGTP pyrophosphatase MutT (NUDIX family)
MINPDIQLKSQLPLAVCVVIRNKEGKVLCVSRRKNPKVFGLIGGKVDPGETELTAVIRETLEESGLVLNPDHLTFLWEGVCPGEQDYWCTTYEHVGFEHAEGVLGNNENLILEFLTPKELIACSCFADYNKTVFERAGISYT